MRDQLATDIELGWIAGIIDGEGWLGFAVSRDKRGGEESSRIRTVVRSELRINNCDPEIIDRAVEILQKLGVNPYRRTQKSSATRRLIHECSCKHMTGVSKILSVLQEHLTGNKKERGELILRFIALRQANPGIPNPVYANGRKGRHGPRRTRPYTDEELALIDACRALQCTGASETSRETRDKAQRSVHQYAAEGWGPNPVPTEKIESSLFGDIEDPLFSSQTNLRPRSSI